MTLTLNLDGNGLLDYLWLSYSSEGTKEIQSRDYFEHANSNKGRGHVRCRANVPYRVDKDETMFTTCRSEVPFLYHDERKKPTALGAQLAFHCPLSWPKAIAISTSR